MVIWLIGKSSVGKSTVGKCLTEKIKILHTNTIFIDGDIFRGMMGNDLGHTIEDRYKNAKRIEEFCVYMDSQNINVVFALLSIFPDVQKSIRERVKNYFQVYLKASDETLKQRDDRGVYDNKKDIVGIDIEFPTPYQSDLTIENNIEDGLSPEEIASRIFKKALNVE
ncbi:adenylyl-sulfate kinase [Sulfuricurvum sp.]|uniref:adenylyl-sulfate kinase n=1 Tax=Sulfuricurvum sp. TaxID=2025608 RepID=UPI0025F75D5C|nr:adenylyl-sulfate kinase [Sulfuricurvum sp.]